MIAQLDIFYHVATFLDFADDLVQAIPEVYRLPSQSLQNMGVMTRRMFVESNKFGETCPHPEIVAEAILARDPMIPRYVLQFLSENPNWKDGDDRLTAVRYLNLVLYDDIRCGFVSVEELKVLCRYDVVLKHAGNLVRIEDYFHGRSIFEMFMLIGDNHTNVMRLAETCDTFESLQEFLDDLYADGYDDHIALIVDNSKLTDTEYDALRERYD